MRQFAASILLALLPLSGSQAQQGMMGGGGFDLSGPRDLGFQDLGIAPGSDKLQIPQTDPLWDLRRIQDRMQDHTYTPTIRRGQNSAPAQVQDRLGNKGIKVPIRAPVATTLKKEIFGTITPETYLSSEQMEKFKRRELPWTELLETLPETQRMDVLLRQLPALPGDDVWAKQTAPGSGVDGTPGYRGTDQPNGGPDRLTVPASGIGETGTGDPCPMPYIYCGNPKRVDLLWNPDGKRSALEYVLEGYPEVVMIALFAGSDPADPRGGINHPVCTATMIAANWAMTALHCIDFDKPQNGVISLDRLFRTEKVPQMPGWSRLVLKPYGGTAFSIWLLSAQLNRAAKVDALYIPYAPGEQILASSWAQPNKDVAIIKLEEDGLKLSPNQLPYIATKHEVSEAISFAGFGWSNTSCKGGNGASDADSFSTQLAKGGLHCIKQAAFNFIERIASVGVAQNPLLIWKQGNDGADGGPCHRDSGGPVYAGFNRGYDGDPRVVVGIVAGLINAPKNKDADRCMDLQAEGLAEQVHLYAADICALTENVPHGCS